MTNPFEKEWKHKEVQDHIVEVQEVKKNKRVPRRVIGWEVWRWPETQAFLKKLGVRMELPITHLTVDLPADDVVTVIQEYLVDKDESDE